MNTIYQFDGFYYNPDTRELIKDNKSSALRRKVAAVLEILLENRHRIVGREELLNSIWREGAMRENSLLQCVRELRQLLNDNAQSPRYIKTYHTKGYQWIGLDTSTKKVDQLDDVRKFPNRLKNNSNKSNNKLIGFKYLQEKLISSRGILLSLLLLTSVLSISYLLKSNNLKQTDANITTLVILPFNNHTGDTTLQWVQMGLTDMVMTALAQSSQLKVIPLHIVQQAVAQQAPSNSNSELLATLNADYLIQSNITKSNLHNYQFNYQIFNLNGELTSESLSSSDIISAIPDIVQKFNNEFSSNVKTGNNQLLTLSKNNQANLDYANGIHVLKTKGAQLAKPHFEAAIKRDPEFLWAKVQLALVLSQLGDWNMAKNQFNIMLQTDQINHDLALKTFVQLSLAKVFIEQSLFTQAETLLQDVLTRSELSNDSYNKVIALWDLSRIAEYRSQWHAQNKFAQQAMALSINSNELRIKADNLYYLGSPSNSRLEFDTNIDMQKNRERLEKALNYYKQLNDVNSQAKTLLSLGENYTFTFEQRIQFLKQAETLYTKLNNKIQLVNTLSYTGYLYIQYHRGGQALFLIQRSYQIAKTIGAVNAELLNHFLLAFSAMDQGIRPTENTDKTQYLNIAEQQFINLLKDTRLTNNSQLYADTSLLLGWTVSEQGKHKNAINYIKQAHEIYLKLKLTTSTEYSIMSLVKEHIAMNNWQLALKLENNPNQNKRTRQYFSRSYYELKQYDKAIKLAELNKSLNKQTWSTQDEAQLIRYRAVNKNQQYLKLPPEPSAHASYCETLPESTE